MPSPNQPAADNVAPYLLRALYDWAMDNRLTPQVLIDAAMEGVIVPPKHVQDGKIVLSIHPNAVADLEMGNEFLRFSARFDGNAFAICVPVAAVMAIYCRENGRGIAFREHSHENSNENSNANKNPNENPNAPDHPADPTHKQPPPVPHLRLVK